MPYRRTPIEEESTVVLKAYLHYSKAGVFNLTLKQAASFIGIVAIAIFLQPNFYGLQQPKYFFKTDIAARCSAPAMQYELSDARLSDAEALHDRTENVSA